MVNELNKTMLEDVFKTYQNPETKKTHLKLFNQLNSLLDNLLWFTLGSIKTWCKLFPYKWKVPSQPTPCHSKTWSLEAART